MEPTSFYPKIVYDVKPLKKIGNDFSEFEILTAVVMKSSLSSEI
jgi:hypothetical protein